ncbi:hypothetical protein TNCV_1162331 [Trichonephila clavipes]|nr:hypothetical protein TNCV_1162331 [Trichonephila clavipes]
MQKRGREEKNIDKNHWHVRMLVRKYYPDIVTSDKDTCEGSQRAVGSLVVRAPDFRPEDLGSMFNATKYPPSTHGVRAR